MPAAGLCARSELIIQGCDLPLNANSPDQVSLESRRYDSTGTLTVERAPGRTILMKRLQLAHLPLRTKLIAASALTASIALLIAALTQGISSYLFSHSEAYEHLN